jgi:TetR/AcrR family transcriptional repressor of nem operon
MKKSREETAATRKKIVEAAAAEFCESGITATGLADVMAAAGLTHGGFYRHFGSKEQILEESLAAAAQGLMRAIEAASEKSGKAPALTAIIASYLSPTHRDDFAHGCPFVALGSELVRSTGNVRQVATAGVVAFVEEVAARIEGGTRAAARNQALFIVSTMVGALSLARMVDDPKLSEAFLKQSFKHLAQHIEGSDSPKKPA